MEVIAKICDSKELANKEISLSVSRVKMFADCKAKYKYCYIEKLPRKTWDHFIFGQYLHEILEDFHRAKIQDPNLSWSDVLNATILSVKNKYSSKLKDELIAEGDRIIEQYRVILEYEFPNVIAVEKEFYLNLNDRVMLNGFIDRVEVEDDGVLKVSDYKTTKDKKFLKDFFQLMTYAYVLMIEDPGISRVRTSFILLRHGFETIDKEYTRKKVIDIGEKFINYADEIRDEKLWRPNPQFLCKYCDYQDSCGAGKNFLIKRGIIEGPKETVGKMSW